MTVLDKRIYRSDNIEFDITTSLALSIGDRIVFELGYPYNNILVFRAKCEDTANIGADMYCIPFIKEGQASTDTGLFVWTLDVAHAANTVFKLILYD